MIVLASCSKARRELLKKLGVRFRVVVPRVQEIADETRPPQEVAVANALLKARDVAGRVRRGIVVACDTFVVGDGRVFGKPRDLADARRMLKRLSRRPHTLYTGLAVIDVARQKEVAGCEATRIVMDPLTDAEITRYFRRVSPLDKAGAFDIQGLGGLFIRRIEGCYFNVVGLPLSKLRALLKKLGVSLLALLFSVSLWGCATEYNVATQRKDLMMYSTDREIAIGEAVAKQVEKEYELIPDPEMNERLQRVGGDVAAVSDRRDVIYRFRVIEDKEDKEIVNAISLPGGYIYVFRNLMKVAETDDELAGVLGHEIAHVVARHAVKRLQAEWGYNILAVLSVASGQRGAAGGTQLAFLSLLSGYSQEDELLADRFGAKYAMAAGYDPKGLIKFIELLKERHKKEASLPLSYFRTHPFTAERVLAAKEAAGEKMSFEDYINVNWGKGGDVTR